MKSTAPKEQSLHSGRFVNMYHLNEDLL